MQPGTLRVPAEADAERPLRHSHAERGNDLLSEYDRSAIFIKLSRNCGSAIDQTSSDSRSTGVLRFGVFHACFVFIGGHSSDRII
jgi:hypothetical protein